MVMIIMIMIMGIEMGSERRRESEGMR